MKKEQTSSGVIFRASGYELRAENSSPWEIWLISPEWKLAKVQFKGLAPYPAMGYFYGYDPEVIPRRVAEAFALAYSRHLQGKDAIESGKQVPSVRFSAR